MFINYQETNNQQVKQVAYYSGVILIACFIYKVLELYSLKHSALLFIGIPIFIGITLAAYSNTNNLTLKIYIGMVYGLVASYLYLNEGSFCVPMTAPLFFLSGFIISFSFRKLKESNHSKKIYYLPLVILIILSTEGITSNLSLNRSVEISVSKETPLSEHTILESLKQNNKFSKIPVLLRWGFPQPTMISNTGINIGDIISIKFSGDEGLPGTAQFQVISQSNNHIEYKLIKDNSHISHWLTWKTSKVEWQTSNTGKTLITWSIEYDRKLDPAWYFGPLQKTAVKLAATTLIDNMILQSRD